MCFGALAGGLLSAIGGGITASQQAANAKRQAAARNDVMNQTLAKNDLLARNARDVFDHRTQEVTPTNVAADQAAATATRTNEIQSAVHAPDVDSVPISGSAPDVVRSAVAQKLLDTFQQGTERAKALGKLGGYGDSWFSQGLKTADASRQVGVDNNFVAGNLSILPYKQDLAEQQAYKPISPIGGILSGLGSYFGGR